MNRLLELEKELARFSGLNTKPNTPAAPVAPSVSAAQSYGGYHYAFEAPKKGKVCVLTIDGGGIRGLIPALILEKLEVMIQQKRSSMLIQDAFDYFGGTSTGGIIAASLLVPPVINAGKDDFENPNQSMNKRYRYKASDIASIYRGNEAQLIFGREPSRFGSKIQKIQDGIYVKYDRAGLDQVLRDRIGGIQFRALLKPCFLTAMNITTGAGRVFDNVTDGRWLAVDVVRATSAAQTYFDPVQIAEDGRRGGNWFADGGMYQNNPSKLVLDRVVYNFTNTESQFGGIASGKSPKITSYPNGTQVSPEDIVFVSLGTGLGNTGVNGEEMLNSGQAFWIRTVLDQAMSSNSIANDVDLRRILGNAQYFRLNPELPGEVEMDDISPANIARMTQAVNNLFTRESERINQLVKLLIDNN